MEGSHLKWVADGVISPDPSLPDVERLAVIHENLKEVLSTHQPDQAMIEELFVSRSAASALKLGMARGVAMLALGQAGLNVLEISARRVKQNITGSGRADKDQVTAMVSRLLGVIPKSADAADALAIAIAASNDQVPGLISGSDVAPSTSGGGGGLDAAIARALEKENAS